MVIVQSQREVTKTGRVFLRAPILRTFATVDVDCVRAVCVRAGKHNFVVPWTKRSEIVIFLTDHDAGILSCQSEKCK